VNAGFAMLLLQSQTDDYSMSAMQRQSNRERPAVEATPQSFNVIKP